MLIHLVGSQWDILEQIANLRKIVQLIHERGASLTRDWVEPTYEIAKKDKNFAEQDWQTIYHENMEAIARADVVIVEGSTQSFAVGFQTAVALQQKKPTLFLTQTKAVLEDNFAAGLDESLLTTSVYTNDGLEKVIVKFLEDNDIKSKDMRFNFFIDRKIYNYLRWAALRTGKTKAEILRDLVEKEIDHENGQQLPKA
jgi:hypothetical protein